ncbi:MAG TPA: hypothetical protein VK348_15860 [Planctomycetota bacterium]|nr:hypothetical protein [Planctomycetota bacterium]
MGSTSRAGLSLLSVLIVATAATAPAQTVWIVDASNGPGANFTNLPAAYAAAAPGDVVMMRPGNYWTGVPFLMSKGITIVGLDPRPNLSDLMIANLPVDQRLVLANCNVGPGQVYVGECRGLVVLDSLAFGTTGGGAGGCEALVMSHCDRAPYGFGIVGGSRAFLSATHWEEYGTWPHYEAGAILEIYESDVHLLDTYAHGTLRSFPGELGCLLAVPGISGIRSRLAIGQGCQIIPGPDETWPSCPPSYGCGVSAYGSVVLVDPSSQVHSCSPVSSFPITAISWGQTGPGQIATTLHAAPNSLAILCESLPVPYTWATSAGDLWLDPFSFQVVSVGPVNAQGFRQDVVLIDPTLLPGNVTTLQAVVLDANGITLSEPAFAVTR